jgi:hypothetical protein
VLSPFPSSEQPIRERKTTRWIVKAMSSGTGNANLHKRVRNIDPVYHEQEEEKRGLSGE